MRLQSSGDAVGLEDRLPRPLTRLLARGLGDSAGPLLVPWVIGARESQAQPYPVTERRGQLSGLLTVPRRRFRGRTDPHSPVRGADVLGGLRLPDGGKHETAAASRHGREGTPRGRTRAGSPVCRDKLPPTGGLAPRVFRLSRLWRRRVQAWVLAVPRPRRGRPRFHILPAAASSLQLCAPLSGRLWQNSFRPLQLRPPRKSRGSTPS